jgi:hypothetical protein
MDTACKQGNFFYSKPKSGKKLKGSGKGKNKKSLKISADDSVPSSLFLMCHSLPSLPSLFPHLCSLVSFILLPIFYSLFFLKAVCINTDISYCIVKIKPLDSSSSPSSPSFSSDKHLIVARDRIPALQNTLKCMLEIVETHVLSEEILGMKYKSPISGEICPVLHGMQTSVKKHSFF